MFAFLTKRILLQQLIYIRRFGCKAAATTTSSSRLVDFMTCNALNLNVTLFFNIIIPSINR